MDTESGNYRVTARKWRPTEFGSVVGQEHITHTLVNAIRNNRLHHAYLFSGPRGVGKTTTARILARALNCLNPGEGGEPCGTCESCQAIASGRSMDVVEIDGASNNSVDDVRGLRDSAKYPPVTGRYKLYIIDEVHMLSTSAFNALLKILEEPPSHLVFVFATTEPHKVLPTILSRCQRFDFRRMQIDSIVSRLAHIAEEEGMGPETDALTVIARKADGSMRDAQSIFDQVRAFCGENFTYEEVHDALNLIDQEFYFRVTAMMVENDPAVAFGIVDHIMKTGYDIEEFLVGLAEHFRHLLSVLIVGSADLIETVDSVRQRYEEESRRLEQGDLIRGLKMTLDAQREIRTAAQPRLRMELLLTRLAVMDRTVRLDQLLAAIAGMPEGGAGGEEPQTGASTRSVSVPTERADDAAPSGSKGSAQGTEQGRSTAEEEGPDSDPNEPTGVSSPSTTDETVEPSAGETETATSPEQGNPSADADAPAGEDPPSDLPGPGEESLFALKNFPTVGASARPSSSSRETRSTDGDDATGVAGSERMVSIDEVQAQWPVFREHYASKPRLMFALEPAVPGEIQGNVLQLCVETERERELIEQYRDDITTTVRSFFRKPLVVEGVIREADRRRTGNGTDAVESSSGREAIPPEIDHPFVRGIVDRLGAVPI